VEVDQVAEVEPGVLEQPQGIQLPLVHLSQSQLALAAPLEQTHQATEQTVEILCLVQLPLQAADMVLVVAMAQAARLLQEEVAAVAAARGLGVVQA
jgi:hypothetical protein